MIASLNNGSGVVVTGGSNGPWVDLSRPSAGLVRYNGNTMEVYDGNNWLSISSHAEVQLDPEIRRVVDWARIKMAEEHDLQRRLKQHPGLRDAYEKFKVMDVLTLEEHQDHGEVQASP
jgi:hypothetical protein